jgi:hypothetical protein
MGLQNFISHFWNKVIKSDTGLNKVLGFEMKSVNSSCRGGTMGHTVREYNSLQISTTNFHKSILMESLVDTFHI